MVKGSKQKKKKSKHYNPTHTVIQRKILSKHYNHTLSQRERERELKIPDQAEMVADQAIVAVATYQDSPSIGDRSWVR